MRIGWSPSVIFVPVNVLYREREVAHIVSDADPRATITEENLGAFVGNDETRPQTQLDGSTPAAIPGLRPGSHTVRVEARGFRTWEGQVQVPPGARVRVQARLQQEQE